jgi:hypothetical protein
LWAVWPGAGGAQPLEKAAADRKREFGALVRRSWSINSKPPTRRKKDNGKDKIAVRRGELLAASSILSRRRQAASSPAHRTIIDHHDELMLNHAAYVQKAFVPARAEGNKQRARPSNARSEFDRRS